MGVKLLIEGLIPSMIMVVFQLLDLESTSLKKSAMSKGMNQSVSFVYSNAFATLILLSCTFIILRNKRPPLTFSILCKIFLLSLFGITFMQNCMSIGVSYSSPTFSSAMSNLVPAFTFLFAAILRLEKLDLRNSTSRIKILGALVSISGALIVTLYKSPSIGTIPLQSIKNTFISKPSFFMFLTALGRNWIIGGLLLATANLSSAISIIAQAAILREYPSMMTILSFYCFFGTIQCAALSLVVERDPNSWTLGPDIQLISIFYSGIIGTGLVYFSTIFCIKMKGSLFVSMLTPLGTAVAVFMGSIFQGDSLHVGSVVGAVATLIGFYGVIWAQLKEEKDEMDKVDRLQCSYLQKSPLLENHTNV